MKLSRKLKYYNSSIRNRDMDELTKLPDILNIDISTFCNLRCITCSLDEHYGEKSIMPMETFEKLTDIFPKIKGIDLNCNAEPFFNKNIFEMIKLVKKVSDNKTFVRSPTNGMLLTDDIMKNLITSGLDLIRFSFDGATPETFERIRVGAKLDTLVNNIKRFGELRQELKMDNPVFTALYVAMRRNIHELSDFIKLASELGIIEVTVLGYEPYRKELTDEVLYFDKKDYFKKAREVASERGIELNYPELSLKSYKKCLFETICLISCEGDVIPCSACAYKRPFYIKENGYMHKRVSFGNINEKPFMDIWNSPEFVDFRRRKKFGLLPEFCDHCLISHGVIVPKGGKANKL